MYVEKAGLKVASVLANFLENDVLPGTGLNAGDFWNGMADILNGFTEENRRLLEKRDTLQTHIDAWYADQSGKSASMSDTQAFLTRIGYLVDEPTPFSITPENVDLEICKLAGPQLVVPIRNARFVLNAANARWGSLYDALYGTDVIPGTAQSKGHDKVRGQKVIDWSKDFLDKVAPLASGSHADVQAYIIKDGGLNPSLQDGAQCVGYRGSPEKPSAILLQNNGLHIEISIARDHIIGRDDPAGVSDIILEAALSTIVDMEDSVAAVDAEDKVEAYSNWLGLMKGDLEAKFEKDGRMMTRALTVDREYFGLDGASYSLSGRSLLLIRNVGHLMTTPSVLMADGSEAFEGILDGIISNLIAVHDLQKNGQYQNSRMGSVYIVKPKMHGPEEADFAGRLYAAIEDMLGLERNIIKVGLMDEERRTSANLGATIQAISSRIFFVNTGFLDRTGDEIHTAMRAGPVVLKEDMKKREWISAYEDRNVQIALACGFTGRAQIGKGMWAAPDMMADMMVQKVGHPKTGANTAWVPSPTAATLHAMHYHDVDVMALRDEIAKRSIPSLDDLLTVPLAEDTNWTDAEITRSLENNIQGILGYVVRWIDQGIGCSKVPDYDDVGLMEDRATLRISSQHVANWLLHGVCTGEQVEAAFERMAAKVDEQNAGDLAYENMSGKQDSIAFQAARALVFQGVEQPNGYTEPLLHAFRIQRKKRDA